MFRKRIAIAIVALAMPAICVIATSENSNKPAMERKSEETGFNLFGLYNQRYYNGLLDHLDSIRKHVIVSMERLNNLEQNLKSQQTEIDAEPKKEAQGAMTAVSSNLMESFQDFLEQQSILDDKIVSLLKFLDFDLEDKEAALSENQFDQERDKSLLD